MTRQKKDETLYDSDGAKIQCGKCNQVYREGYVHLCPEEWSGEEVSGIEYKPILVQGKTVEEIIREPKEILAVNPYDPEKLAQQEIVRVLRVIEYTGPREIVENQVRLSIHGEKKLKNGLVIRAATIGQYPEVLQNLDVDTRFDWEQKIDPRKQELQEYKVD